MTSESSSNTSNHTPSDSPKQTPLFDQHVALDARMVDFGGWQLPVNYGSQIEEHIAVRKSAGIFDVSHMTVWDIEGAETIPYLRKILANDINRVSGTVDKAIYSCLLNNDGGVIDDLIAYYLSDTCCRVVTNAGTRDKVKIWLLEQAKNFTVDVIEQPELALIAVQGPDSLEKFHQAVGPIVGDPAAELKKFCSTQISEWFIGRTGYTGENGIEVILPNRDVAGLWESLINVGLRPCGLGARDTLRLEAGLSLYGNDLDEQHSPLESGLLWTVSLQDPSRDFIGRRALESQMQSSHKQLVGLVLEDRGVLRSHQKVLINGQERGEITSGTWSPSLEKSIALARVTGDAGKICSVEIRNKPVDARIVPVPFIKNGVSQVGRVIMDNFTNRHLGPRESDIQSMLDALGYNSLDELTEAVVPKSILDNSQLELAEAASEHQALAELKALANQNLVLKSLIGQGYSNTLVPAVIQRNVFENPAWYTAYTPYQPEISQGRLEVLFYYQTMITELTGMDIANASLLDEATAAAEAMTLAHRQAKGRKSTLLVSTLCHPQTIELLTTRAEPIGIQLVYIDESKDDPDTLEWGDVFGLIVQYPTTDGRVLDYSSLFSRAQDNNAVAIVASDLLALTLLKSPGELGADVVIGNSQRFGVPLGFGGPHAGFFAVKDKLKRTMPGRLVGESIDTAGNPAYRLALQTREQHIRREKATSNICTAQALLAIMATLYAVYHGPDGLTEIALDVQSKLARLKQALKDGSYKISGEHHFDTVSFNSGAKTDVLIDAAVAAGFNLRKLDDNHLAISLDETTSTTDLENLADALGLDLIDANNSSDLNSTLLRTDTFLSQQVFHQYRSETEMMRYLKRLSNKDIALDQAMIPLGSCTMKLNAAVEMQPVSWPEINSIHPFAPPEQWQGYREMIRQLEEMLCACTGYAAVSLQPNAGSQGEYAGLLAIRQYHIANGDTQRNICLIPQSAHGTNPASAQMVDMRVVVVACDDAGNVDLDDLDRCIAEHQTDIAAIMITYPSTHGVFEEHVSQVCAKVHDTGGQVYIDGANLNAMVGVAKPGRFGGDVSHLNLHKTFCIPHGGGGPGVGPIAVAEHLAPYLPQDALNKERIGATISGAPFGSASILPISWMYIRMMGAEGLKKATQVAILNANYIAHRLKDAYPVLYTGNKGLVAHECIIDTRPMKTDANVSVDDIAKRLIDYGFHAPTMSFPVPGTLMIEPTESESLEEIERFCRAMLTIHKEYLAVKNDELPEDNNPLSNAPHTLESIMQWDRPYSIRQALSPDEQANPADKYWPPIGRIDNVFGDRNLVCSCPPLADYVDN